MANSSPTEAAARLLVRCANVLPPCRDGFQTWLGRHEGETVTQPHPDCDGSGIDPEKAAALALIREEAYEVAAEKAEALLHAEPGPGEKPDASDRIAAYSNGTVRRIASAIRAMKGKA